MNPHLARTLLRRERALAAEVEPLIRMVVAVWRQAARKILPKTGRWAPPLRTRHSDNGSPLPVAVWVPKPCHPMRPGHIRRSGRRAGPGAERACRPHPQAGMHARQWVLLQCRVRPVSAGSDRRAGPGPAADAAGDQHPVRALVAGRCHAACPYSLISPPRTLCRRSLAVVRSVIAACGARLLDSPRRPARLEIIAG